MTKSPIITALAALLIALPELLACTPAPAQRCQPGARCAVVPSGPTANVDGKRPAARPLADRRHVIVVSVDGLMPESYLQPDRHGLRVPTLREMKAKGAYAKEVLSVFPTVTYPAHTSMVTGMSPVRHGIVNNRTLDPLQKNKGGWYWYTEDIAVPTVWQIARAAGRITALINWPVTVGAKADYLVAEYWRAGTLDDVKLSKALSTRGLLERVGKRFPSFWQDFRPPDVIDRASIDVAVHLLEENPPELMLIHIWMVDEYQHQKGPWSPEAKERIERADAQLGRLIEAAKKAGIWSRTTLFVVSDHGFLPVEKRLYPGVLLRQRGFVTLDQKNPQKVQDWQATAQAAGGLAFIHVKDPEDQATAAAVEQAFADYAAQPDSGIGRIYKPAEIAARGGDDRALLAIEARPGYAFKDGYAGDLVVATPGKGTHGYDPERPELKASLLVYGPGVGRGEIRDARLIDMAPTWAHWLGESMPKGLDGRRLDIPTAAVGSP